jgi:hypothetical protein
MNHQITPVGSTQIPLGRSFSGLSFSQPRLRIIASLPKFGFRVMFYKVRTGTIEAGVLIRTPQT